MNPNQQPGAGYPPPQAGYPPPQGGYPPPQGAYPPPQGGYPPPQGGYPPPQGGYPPPQGGYPPPQGGYPPPQGGYPPPQGVPAQGGFSQPSYGAVPGGAVQVTWMQRPTIPNCPPGLEYLTMVDQLLIKQKVEMLEVMMNVEMANKYLILNTMGQQVYYASEDSEFCQRNCCGPSRSFVMNITDNLGHEVIRIIRPYKCNCCGQCLSCLNCCQDEIEVQAPVGHTIGWVKQLYDGCDAQYAVKDNNGVPVLRIHGPNCCHCQCIGEDVKFRVQSADGASDVGMIMKQWTGFAHEFFTDADNFGVQFPMDLDVRVKATLLGAVFLIDFMFFETKAKKD